MLLTRFDHFLSTCIQQKPLAAEIIESDDDFAQPAAGAAPPAAGADRGAGGRAGGSGVLTGAKGRSAVRDDDEAKEEFHTTGDKGSWKGGGSEQHSLKE